MCRSYRSTVLCMTKTADTGNGSCAGGGVHVAYACRLNTCRHLHAYMHLEGLKRRLLQVAVMLRSYDQCCCVIL